MSDRIADRWGPRTPYGPGEEWPVRVDRHLEGDLTEADVDSWVPSASILHSNGDAMDIAVKDGRVVGVRGRAADRVNHGRLDPKDLYGWARTATCRGCATGTTPSTSASWAELWNVEPSVIPHWAPPTHAMQIFRYAEQGSIRPAGRPCDYTGITYGLLRGGGVQWPCTPSAPHGTERLYTDGRFNTDPGYCETYGHDLTTGAEYGREHYTARQPAGRRRRWWWPPGSARRPPFGDRPPGQPPGHGGCPFVMDVPGRLDLDYVLPLRWHEDAGLGELTAYLRVLARHVRVIVVDGSPAELFDRHARRWRGLVRHVRPADGLRFANGKVAGVTTGVRLATGDRVVIADDDVRYDLPGLAAVHALLRDAELVRPQNYFSPLPWHSRWDTARTLLNRGLGADYPGTFGLRRAFFLRAGGYDGDVLFENLELIRTVRAHGGREARPPGLYVRRLPCDARHFWGQRVRQAYDDRAQPVRMAAFLAVLPALALIRRPRTVLTCAALAVCLAETGRRRAGGRRVFPVTGSLLAPVWILERAVCSWFALGAALTGGIPYAGGRIRHAAHSVRRLRRRARTAGRAETGGLVRAVAERLDRGQATPAERDRRPAGVDRLAVLGAQFEAPA
ncbi:hypothetical protein [Spongiactinospora sp. TRM90649]|uniref:hypothetical protein n=1 Tax=Spongiactinospora sp. TRM90649 TaxID=3031114 RepID=UPI0023FA339A|nr:hypothetical protein [Spongiactinospora sp. TRM90649]MDF5752802.1 hypothetical protein [Spongiactinospora sp. TRM90649]